MIQDPTCGRANIMDVINKGEVYLTFVFDGIDTTAMKIASVTEGGTYNTGILPSFNDNVLETDGYDGRYYFNTRLVQKDFSFTCFIDNLSAFDFDQIKSWIRPKKIGKLIRPEEPYRYYWVKVSSIDELENIPLTHPDTGGVSYTGYFNITFTTIGQACGNGMMYYQDDLQYYEYRDIFNNPDGIYYDSGLLYKEEMLPLSMSVPTGELLPNIYNPGTYNSKILLKITTPETISGGSITIINKSTGDVSIVELKNINPGDVLELNWDNNTYTLNGLDYSEFVKGDIIYLQPRNLIERVNNAVVSNTGHNTTVQFNTDARIVRNDDIGKVISFKKLNGDVSSNGVGGVISAIDVTTNSFILDKSAGLLTNPNTEVIITKMDQLDVDITIPTSEINLDWQVKPRYL